MFDATTIALLLVQFLIAGSCFYVILCADPNSKGLLGRAHRFVFQYIPSLYNSKRSASSSSNIFFRMIDKSVNYICNTNHPLVQVFYVIIAGGGACIYYYFGALRHFPNTQVSEIHITIIPIFAIFCFYSYYLVCSVGPGSITKENSKHKLKQFEPFYDEVLFEKGNKCTTCNTLKPARSKHCKTCNMCVSRFDHHCIWIRQCVGEKNYKYFLLFIASHAFLTLYGATIGLFALYGIIIDSNLLRAKFRVSGSDEVVSATWQIIIKFIFYKETMFVFMVVLCTVMGVTLFMFMLYHFNMVKDNITTNERIKRSDYMTFIERELVRLEKLKKSTESEEEIKVADAKIKKYNRDYNQLKKWFPTQGFIKSLLKVIRA